MELPDGGAVTRAQRIEKRLDDWGRRLYDALFAAAQELGLPTNEDYNGSSQEGIVKTQTTIADGRRMSTAYAYLDPIRDRRNLRIRTGALATGLELEAGVCTGGPQNDCGMPPGDCDEIICNEATMSCSVAGVDGAPS